MKKSKTATPKSDGKPTISKNVIKAVVAAKKRTKAKPKSAIKGLPKNLQKDIESYIDKRINEVAGASIPKRPVGKEECDTCRLEWVCED
ncbi:MAG: hypothetical protein AAFZ15_27565 [Bacteroidota bacterium]